MSLPGNGIFVVRGEMSTLITAMRRSTRWNGATYGDEEKDGLIKLFMDLKQILNRIEDLRLIDPNIFLAPFLEVIRTDETTGAVTSLALAAINKFLSYGLIDPTCTNLAVTVENIADAVTHARFMGADQSSDGVTLFRVVEVLHTLMRSPEGSALTNEAVCEVMLSCFKICFEPRLNELLRRFAEQALKDMVLLLFMRLPQFSEDRSEAGLLKKFQMMAASMEKDKKQRKKHNKNTTTSSSSQRSGSTLKERSEERKIASVNGANDEVQPQTPHTLSVQHLKAAPLATTPASPIGNILDMQGKITQTPTTALNENNETTPTTSTTTNIASKLAEVNSELKPPQIEIEVTTPEQNASLNIEQQESTQTTKLDGSNEYINSMGVRFTHQNSLDGSEGMTPLVPYGLPCVQELFRFLILICNPLDKQNTDTMMHMGLSLLTVAFEVGADNIGKYDTLLELVRDDLCRNLISLMSSERLSIFAADLQLCFLLFESLRGHLKFQLEAFLKKLSEIIVSDNPKTPYEVRELALDNLLQLCCIPGFVTELYINYDCDLYCTDMFESITNLLSKFTLSATNAVYSTHLIAMETLLCIIDNIENNCIAAKNSATSDNPLPAAQSNRHSRQNSGLEGIIIDTITTSDEPKYAIENISKFINSSSRVRLDSTTGSKGTPSMALTSEQLAEVKQKKRILSQGTELFNQRPDKGIQHLQEHGILNPDLDPMEVALFLRENPGLDKKMIGEYISRKKNVDSKILMNFVESFDFVGLRVDQALRLYLETFRLPGEAPLIFLVLEHFADHWHKQNGEPFANTDAAFSLAYAIIMLNMDQHNSNAKRLNVPMTQEEFMKNLRGLNDSKDFDQDMLAAIFNAIKNEEIVMPAEQTGIVRENYLWKVLLRRGRTPDAVFTYVQDASYDLEIFNIIWGASLSALSFMFDKSNESDYQRTLSGFTKSAGIAAHYQQHEDFDAIVLTLCKFTTLLNSMQQEAPTTSAQHNEIVQAVNFGLNPKAQAAVRTVFLLVHDYGDCLREGWKNILDIYLQLFKLKLLPKSLMEVEDFCEANGKALLILEKPSQKQEAGLFSSLYSYLSSEGQREPTYEEQEFIKLGKKCIKDCQLEQMIQETKFVQLESLQELMKSVLVLIKAPNAHKSIGLPYAEDIVVFWMEFLVKVVIHNRDRMIPLWAAVRDQMYLLLLGSASCGYDYLLNRCIVAVLKLAIYLMRNEELCPIVLQSLKMLLMLKPTVILRISKQISIGIYELLKTSAQNIHSEQDWQIIFTILECVGAGAIPPEFDDTTLPAPNGSSAKSDGALSSEEDSGLPDRGYISDSEISVKQQQLDQQYLRQTSNTSSPFPASPTSENWILVNKDTDLSTLSRPQSPPTTTTTAKTTTSSSSTTAAPTLSTLIYDCKLLEHAPFALFKCWDSLAFIVRNVAHITPYNFESCVRCIRTFVEACRDGGVRQRRKFEAEVAAKTNAASTQKKKSTNKRAERDAQRKAANFNGNEPYGSDARSDPEEEDLAQRYETLSIQLLDLMYTLYTRTAQIFRWWAEEGCAVPQCSALWAQGWCPLLQGIARLAMDRRREVRTYAISCLQQRALLVHDLQTLSGVEWASCFQYVLFPLLNELLPESSSVVYLDTILLEESRIRTATIMAKVFLHHLTPLIELGNAFNDLWLEILDYIEKFMKVGSDMLSEQMQEILKNMLLVMHSVRVFHHSDGLLHQPLWDLTWRRIDEFLPNLKDLFRDEGKHNRSNEPSTTSTSTTTDISIVPQVAILPNQQQPQQQMCQPNQQKPQSTNEYITTKSPIGSPVESPRHSIILQPPVADALQGQTFILGQLPMAHSMPILIPPASLATDTLPQSPTQQPALSAQHNMPTLIQPIPIAVTSSGIQSPTVLPDILSDTSQVGKANDVTKNTINEQFIIQQQQQQQQQEQQKSTTIQTSGGLETETSNSVTSHCSFSIDLPEPQVQTQTEPALTATDICNVQPQESANKQQEQYASNDQQQQEFLQQQYQQYYEQYQQYLFQMQNYQLQQNQQLQQSTQQFTDQQQQHEQPKQALACQQLTMEPPVVIPTPATASTYTVDSINGSLAAASVEITKMENVGNTAANIQEDTVNVPISHLIAGNQYPSLNKMPNAAIVHSFTPVYVQNEVQQAGSDIYHEYVQNPYNLTLQQEHNLNVSEQSAQQQQNLSSAANYFANNTIDSKAIPPGSEILFGQH